MYAGEEWQVARSLSLEQVVEECFFSVGVAFRRRVLDVAGGHRTGVYVDDYDLWLRAMARGARHLYTPQVLALHRVSSFQQSFASLSGSLRIQQRGVRKPARSGGRGH